MFFYFPHHYQYENRYVDNLPNPAGKLFFSLRILYLKSFPNALFN